VCGVSTARTDASADGVDHLILGSLHVPPKCGTNASVLHSQTLNTTINSPISRHLR
jgi:hypothetical protein